MSVLNPILRSALAVTLNWDGELMRLLIGYYLTFFSSFARHVSSVKNIFCVISKF